MRKIALIILALSLAVSAAAGDKAVEDLLAKMRKAYEGLKTATFTLESTLSGRDGDLVVKLEGGFKSPKMLYVNIDIEDVKLKVISDGKRIYKVNVQFDQVADIPYSDDNMGEVLIPWANLEVINLYEWPKQLSTDQGDNMHDSQLSIRQSEEWNGKTWLVLEELAPTANPPIYVEYYIDPETHLVWRTIQMTFDKEFVLGDFVLKALNRGAKISDWRFWKPIW